MYEGPGQAFTTRSFRVNGEAVGKHLDLPVLKCGTSHMQLGYAEDLMPTQSPAVAVFSRMGAPRPGVESSGLIQGPRISAQGTWLHPTASPYGSDCRDVSQMLCVLFTA